MPAVNPFRFEVVRNPAGVVSLYRNEQADDGTTKTELVATGAEVYALAVFLFDHLDKQTFAEELVAAEDKVKERDIVAEILAQEDERAAGDDANKLAKLYGPSLPCDRVGICHDDLLKPFAFHSCMDRVAEDLTSSLAEGVSRLRADRVPTRVRIHWRPGAVKSDLVYGYFSIDLHSRREGMPL